MEYFENLDKTEYHISQVISCYHSRQITWIVINIPRKRGISKFLPFIVEKKVYNDSLFSSRNTFYTESSTLSHQSIAFQL